MKPQPKIDASVLPTVLAVSLLVSVMMMGLLSLYELDFLFFARLQRIRTQKDNIESLLTLYRYDPTIASRLEADSSLVLYDTLPSSRIKLTCSDWGLYEVVVASSCEGDLYQGQILGLSAPANSAKDVSTLWYKDNNSALTLTGDSNIEGEAWLPRNGVIYGQMQSIYFKGEKLSPTQIKKSSSTLPAPDKTRSSVVEKLFGLRPNAFAADSMTVSFRSEGPAVIAAQGNRLADCYYAGNIVITGGRIEIARSAHLRDVIVVGREVVVEDGFRGAVQLFARDTARVGKDVAMEYPSGIYAEKNASLGDNSLLEGYMVVDCKGNADKTKANCVKARTSRLRGLLYVKGIAQLQGTVAGVAWLDKATYYSPHGYYEDMLFDASLFGRDEAIYPLWLDAAGKRETIKWVR